MSIGALTLTCLSLALGQLPADVVAMNQREFRIPVTIDAKRRPEIDVLMLYVSTDHGRSWLQEQRLLPGKDGFVFGAPRDGEYWFRLVAINRQGGQEPNNLYEGPPDQKVLIDTLKPIVQITLARRQGEYVVVEWMIQEKHPDLGSIKVRYRPTHSPSAIWSLAKIEPSLRGRANVRVNDSSPLTFRVEVRDMAGNFSYAEINVPGSLTTASFNDNSPRNSGRTIAERRASNSPAPGTKNDNPLPVPPDGNHYKIVEGPTRQNPPAPNPTIGKQPGEKEPVQVGQAASWDSNVKVPPKKTQQSDLPPAPPKETQPSLPAPVTKKKRSAAVAASHRSVSRSLPPVQYTNKSEVVLAYELSHIQPGRVGAIELWLTKNDGQQWERWMEDPTIQMYMKKGRYTRSLKLPGEGVYGLSLVVFNRAGKGKKPQPGDAPEMRIEVDMTPPVARLYRPEESKHQKNSLILSWDAHDRNLTPDPITLEWAEQPNGPWQTIAANLPNSGKYSWQLPTNIPVWVYLRLRVRDRAGNEAIAISNEPQLMDLSEPQGRLIGIVREKQ